MEKETMIRKLKCLKNIIEMKNRSGLSNEFARWSVQQTLDEIKHVKWPLNLKLEILNTLESLKVA